MRRRLRTCFCCLVLLVPAAIAAGCTSSSGQPSASGGTAPSSGPAGRAPARQPAPPRATVSTPANAGAEVAGGPPRACSVVTAGDAVAALGRPVGPAVDQTLGLFSSCSFTTPGAAQVGTATVQVRRAATDRASVELSARQNPAGGTSPVAGLGDYAAAAGGTLIVLKGTIEFTVSIHTQDQPNGILAAEVALARRVAARI